MPAANLVEPAKNSEPELRYIFTSALFSKEDLLSVLDDGEVDFNISSPDGEPCQQYFIRNKVNGSDLLVEFELCYYNNKSVEVLSFTSNNEKEVCDF